MFEDEDGMEGLRMRFTIALAVSAIYGAALMPVQAQAAAASPARAVTAPEPGVIYVQSTGSTKIRKECEAKADKQKLKGVTHQGYVEQCMNALSFTTEYGTNRANK
jgi:hypothetical protein